MFARYNGQVIMAHPIHAGTFLGTALNLDVSEKSTVAALDDGKITFNFSDPEVPALVVSVLMGQDFGITSDVATISSNGQVLVS